MIKDNKYKKTIFGEWQRSNFLILCTKGHSPTCLIYPVTELSPKYPDINRTEPSERASYLDGHIDKMTYKLLNSCQNPPKIPEFYMLTKIHKSTPVGRPTVSCSGGPAERISSFVDTLLQPIAKKQESYIKDITHFINFI